MKSRILRKTQKQMVLHRLPVLGKGEKIARRQGPEEMCLTLEHQHPSKTTLKNGLFRGMPVALPR